MGTLLSLFYTPVMNETNVNVIEPRPNLNE
jgi:hypothetical protein